jgi:hypothetical protein
MEGGGLNAEGREVGAKSTAFYKRDVAAKEQQIS